MLGSTGSIGCPKLATHLEKNDLETCLKCFFTPTWQRNYAEIYFETLSFFYVFKPMAFRNICLTYQAFFQSKEVSVWPLWRWPGRQVLNVRGQVYLKRFQFEKRKMHNSLPFPACCGWTGVYSTGGHCAWKCQDSNSGFAEHYFFCRFNTSNVNTKRWPIFKTNNSYHLPDIWVKTFFPKTKTGLGGRVACQR